MFVCLSSGSSPRYREDIFRALSMPWGSVLQFRYHRDWIASNVLSSEEITRRLSPEALIAYVDQSDPKNTPEIIPCRMASIIDVEEHGTTVSFQLQLKDFAYAGDLANFNLEAQKLAAGTLPAWQPNGKLKGDYWAKVDLGAKSVTRSANLATFELIVKQLVERQDFKDEGCFYTVVAMNDVASREAVSIGERGYEFAPGREYELRIYHFYPKGVPLTTTLHSAHRVNGLRSRQVLPCPWIHDTTSNVCGSSLVGLQAPIGH